MATEKGADVDGLAHPLEALRKQMEGQAARLIAADPGLTRNEAFIHLVGDDAALRRDMDHVMGMAQGAAAEKLPGTPAGHVDGTSTGPRDTGPDTGRIRTKGRAIPAMAISAAVVAIAALGIAAWALTDDDPPTDPFPLASDVVDEEVTFTREFTARLGSETDRFTTNATRVAWSVDATAGCVDIRLVSDTGTIESLGICTSTSGTWDLEDGTWTLIMDLTAFTGSIDIQETG